MENRRDEKIVVGNNIKRLIDERGVSINKLSKNINMTYKATHALVNRDSLGSTKLETILNVADFLNVDPEEIYLNYE